MNYLSVEGLARHYGDRTLFENLNFGLAKGDKVALIAANGTGKSTLLNILAGKDSQDEGQFTFRDGIRIGMLEQEPIFDPNLKINELIMTSHSEMLKIIRSYEKAMEAQTDNYNSTTQTAFEEASAEMDQHNAWDYELRMKQTLSLFNFTDLDQKIGKLSGGQKKRLALALVLLDKPDILLLDEPTNHLDIDMIEWLEKELKTSATTLLMVTHDRYFLDNVCNHILEMEDLKLYVHQGNYAYYLEKKAEREIVMAIEVDKAKKLMKKELEWMRRSPKARTTKSKARIDAFYETKEKATVRKDTSELRLDLQMSRLGGKILELEHIKKSYGDIKILNDFNFIFKKGERVGVLGKNGVGKSSFLNIISNLEKADSGEMRLGDNTVIGYYRQDGIKLDDGMKVLDVVKEIAEVIKTGDGHTYTASQFLIHFMFPPKVQQSHVSKLSGGEKRRLYLLTVLIKNPNFLILDEPTNDLDLSTLNKLEDFLQAYKGCLMLVSHDRYFMDKLVDHLFIFEGDGEVKDFYGNYTDYQIQREEKEKKLREKKLADKRLEDDKKKLAKKPKAKTKLTFNEKREYDQLEKEIDKLENEKAELESEINSGETDYSKLQQMSSRIAELIEIIDEKSFRWMELDEFV